MRTMMDSEGLGWGIESPWGCRIQCGHNGSVKGGNLFFGPTLDDGVKGFWLKLAAPSIQCSRSHCSWGLMVRSAHGHCTVDAAGRGVASIGKKGSHLSLGAAELTREVKWFALHRGMTDP